MKTRNVNGYIYSHIDNDKAADYIEAGELVFLFSENDELVSLIDEIDFCLKVAQGADLYILLGSYGELLTQYEKIVRAYSYEGSFNSYLETLIH